MILTTPNLEKDIKAITSVFSRNKNNVRTYELEALESVLKHIESTLKTNINGFRATETLVTILMLHYTISFGSAREGSEMLKNDVRMGFDVLLFKLYNKIIINEGLAITEGLEEEGASKERIEACVSKFENEYTIENVMDSVKKTTHDIVTIVNGMRDGIF